MKRLSVATLVLAVSVLTGSFPALGAGEGRIAGTVVDPEGNPIEGVEITVNAIGFSFEATRTTNKKGRFTLLLMDATKDYTIRFDKEGFMTLEEPLDPPLGDTMRQTWTLIPGQGGGSGVGQAAAEVPSEAAARGQAGRKYAQGMEAFEQENYATARQRFEEVIELEPDLPEAHTALAMVMLRQESWEEALAQSDKVLTLRPDDVMALKVKYEAYKGMGDVEMEDALLDKLMEVSESDEELARLAFNSGVAKVQAGDLDSAVRRFEQVKELSPTLMPAYSALARVYFDLGRFEDSIAMADEYLAANPDEGDVLGVLYLAYDQLGRTEEAEATFERLKSADSQHITRVMEEMGVGYFNQGNTERAVDLFERVLEIDPDHARAHYHLALCYAGLGDTAKAKELLSRFLELAPDDPDAALAREMIDSM